MKRMDFSHIWKRAATLTVEPPDRARRGRVLRVKEGYNPNSSSVGSFVPLYLSLATGAGALAVLLLNVRSLIGSLLRERQGESPTAADEPPAADRTEPGEELDDQ